MTLLLDLIYAPTKNIKLSQTVLKVWAAQVFGFRGDKYKTKKVKIVSFGTRPAYKSLAMPLVKIIKMFRIIEKLWNTQEVGLEIRSVEMTR